MIHRAFGPRTCKFYSHIEGALGEVQIEKLNSAIQKINGEIEIFDRPVAPENTVTFCCPKGLGKAVREALSNIYRQEGWTVSWEGRTITLYR